MSFWDQLDRLTNGVINVLFRGAQLTLLLVLVGAAALFVWAMCAGSS